MPRVQRYWGFAQAAERNLKSDYNRLKSETINNVKTNKELDGRIKPAIW